MVISGLLAAAPNGAQARPLRRAAQAGLCPAEHDRSGPPAGRKARWGTMPGLPKVPAAENIDVDENGRITGLF